MKQHKYNLKIIAATSMTIFSLAVVFIATSAWFTVSRRVKTDGDGFDVVSYDGLVKKITAHKLESTNENIRNYNTTPAITYTVDSKTGSISMSGDVTSLGIYDSLQANTIFSCLYVITFDSNVAKTKSSNINIVPSTNTTKENSLLLKNISRTNNPMSSILTFSYGESSTMSEGYSIDLTDKESEKFLDITKKSYIQTLNGLSINPSNITSSDEYYGFVYVSYEISNIEYIYNLNLGSEVLNSIDTTDITYTQDWKITIS